LGKRGFFGGGAWDAGPYGSWGRGIFIGRGVGCRPGGILGERLELAIELEHSSFALFL